MSKVDDKKVEILVNVATGILLLVIIICLLI